ncbi:hypothetical protein HUW46_08616 [Amycolatopsis sp. CA-230715]|nr:hypothetical protein HUW46_08616 [Amycolatopsis sp. CA-230715]
MWHIDPVMLAGSLIEITGRRASMSIDSREPFGRYVTGVDVVTYWQQRPAVSDSKYRLAGPCTMSAYYRHIAPPTSLPSGHPVS